MIPIRLVRASDSIITNSFPRPFSKMLSKKSQRLGHLSEDVSKACDPIFASDGSVTLAAVKELRALVAHRFVDAKVCPGQSDLVLYNYTPRQQAYGAWTSMAKACRGLVLRHHDGVEGAMCATVVARPLAKFFNAGEHSASLERGESFSVLDKVDGSLGVAFYDNGAWRVNTRGSWVSTQAVPASGMLASLRINALDPSFTYCVEIIYPENRVVVDYGERRELTLLAATERATGRELSWNDLAALALAVGCPVVRKFGDGVCADADPAALTTQVLSEWGSSTSRGDEAEGFVLLGSSGTRLKIKYAAYLELHRIKSTPVSDVTVWEAASAGGGIDALLATVPDEFYGQITEVHDRLVASYDATFSRMAGVLDALTPAQRESRREAAKVFKEAGELSSVLFIAYSSESRKLHEDASVRERIWKLVKPATATFITYQAIY